MASVASLIRVAGPIDVVMRGEDSVNQALRPSVFSW